MNGILMCLSVIAALSFYTPEEFANRCRKFGIQEEDCQGSIYVNNMEYDNFLKSFNLPIHKDPECEKKRCFVSVFRDPPRVFVKSAGDVNCMSGYMCSRESYQGSPGKVHMNAHSAKWPVPWNVFSVTTTVYQPVPYLVPPSDTATQSGNCKKQQASTEAVQSAQQTTSTRTTAGQSSSISTTAGQTSSTSTTAGQSSSANTTAGKTSSISVPSEDVITLLKPVYSTVTIDNPITLYREITTTVIHEVPLTNYKVTTVTEEVSTTRTVEKTVSATETCTKTVSVTESISKTIVSTHQTTSVSTEYIVPAAPTRAPSSSATSTIPPEKPATASTSTGAVSSEKAASLAGGDLSISVKTVTETLLGGSDAKKMVAPAPVLSSMSISTMLSGKAPAEQLKIDVPQLLKPVIEQLSMCKERVSETSQGASDMEQKTTVYRTKTLPVTETETETRTVKKVKTVTRAGTAAKRGREKGPQTVYNTVYAYKKRKENPAKRPCVPKECLDEKEVVSTVFVYK